MKKLFTILIAMVTMWSFGQNCSSYFTYEIDTANSNLVWFYDQSYGVQNQTPISWFWEFGDNETSTSQNPYHEYDAGGLYLVQLHVAFADSCTNTYSDSIYISGNPADPCQGFSVNLPTYTTTPAGECLGNLTANVIGGASPYTYLWSNGETNMTIDNLCTGPYSVTVTDENGCNATAQSYVYEDSTNYQGVVDSLYTDPVDTCFGYTVVNVTVTDITMLDSTLQITWVFYADDSISQSTITTIYDFLGQFGDYYVEITVNCANQKASQTWGEVITIDENIATEIRELNKLFGVNLYPNPVSNTLNINVNSDTQNNVRIDVINYTGQTILSNVNNVSQGNNTISLDVSSLTQGVYFAKISTDNNVKTVKFVKK